MMVISSDSTLEEARNWLRDRAVNGGDKCPCCSQYSRVYKRTITSTMARFLVDATKQHVDRWFRIEDVVSRRADEAKLRYWGLIEEHAIEPSLWRVTNKGSDFVRGYCTVQKYSLIYDGRFLRFDGEDIDIHDALGKSFSLQELLAS